MFKLSLTIASIAILVFSTSQSWAGTDDLNNSTAEEAKPIPSAETDYQPHPSELSPQQAVHHELSLDPQTYNKDIRPFKNDLSSVMALKRASTNNTLSKYKITKELDKGKKLIDKTASELIATLLASINLEQIKLEILESDEYKRQAEAFDKKYAKDNSEGDQTASNVLQKDNEQESTE